LILPRQAKKPEDLFTAIWRFAILYDGCTIRDFVDYYQLNSRVTDLAVIAFKMMVRMQRIQLKGSLYVYVRKRERDKQVVKAWMRNSLLRKKY
jgi:hypothetical protein